MLHLIAENPIRFILALVIGIATAWWIWGRVSASASASGADANYTPTPSPAPTPTPAPTPAPAPEPEPTVTPVAVASTAAPQAADEGKPRIAEAVGESDDLTKINGIGPKLCELCNSLGVRRFDQIAGWSDQDVAEVDGHLGNFKGRIARDSWVDQAKLLAAGNLSEWEARFGYKGSR